MPPNGRRMGGDDSGYGLNQKLGRALMESAPDVATSGGYKAGHGEDAYASDGSDSDAGGNDGSDIGLPGPPGFNAPGSSVSQLVTSNIPPTSMKTTRNRSKASNSIEDEYPGLFLPLTREYNENVVDGRIQTKISYPWKDNTVDISPEQFVRMKSILSDEISRHFIAFGTSRGIPWAIKTKFPWLDCSTKNFQALRQHGINHNGHLKHDYIYEKLYTYLYRTYKKYPDMANMTNEELFSFLGDQFDQALVERLWAKTIRVLDVNKTFANRKKLGSWWLRQVFLNMSLRVLPLMYSEVALNPRIEWTSRAPSGWSLDMDRRMDVNWFFDCLSIAPEFNEVELEDFEWMPQQAIPLSKRARGTLSRTEARLIGVASHDR
ncbi:hypothetical protein F4861DRAFT_361319 [Xylaria intraflava]|nr:hypothetical protein F4861DRAFT_361319 [Xylaria intraflava]